MNLFHKIQGRNGPCYDVDFSGVWRRTGENEFGFDRKEALKARKVSVCIAEVHCVQSPAATPEGFQ